jgi:hypothetical protein
VRPASASLGVALALSVLAACEHPRPFGAPDLGANVPFSQDFPRQLTFSASSDREPFWLPDGSGIIYSYQRLDRPDHDRCLGILPPEGGQRVRTICHVPPVADADSTNALWSPVVGPGGVLAYVRESSPPGSLTAPDPGRVVLRFPYAAPDGTTQGSAAYLRWVDARTLLYLAVQVTYNTDTVPPDTVLTPIEIVRLRLSGDSATVVPLPNTVGATSLAVAGIDTVYFTLPADSVVYAVDLAGGPRAVAHDFRALGPVSDVQRQDGRLFVVAGHETGLGLGGDVYVLDPGTDTVAMLDGVPADPDLYIWYRHPAVSDFGARVAAEAYRVIKVPHCIGEGCIIDTVVTRGADLWLLRVP